MEDETFIDEVQLLVVRILSIDDSGIFGRLHLNRFLWSCSGISSSIIGHGLGFVFSISIIEGNSIGSKDLQHCCFLVEHARKGFLVQHSHGGVPLGLDDGGDVVLVHKDGLDLALLIESLADLEDGVVVVRLVSVPEHLPLLHPLTQGGVHQAVHDGV